MKYASAIVSVLLGLLFLMASVTFFLGMVPEQQLPPGSAQESFTKAFGPTGYMMFVKVCEFIGAVLVIIPKTRNFGLLVLGPIIVNILAFTVLVMKGEGMMHPFVIAVIVFPLFLLFLLVKRIQNPQRLLGVHAWLLLLSRLPLFLFRLGFVQVLWLALLVFGL